MSNKFDNIEKQLFKKDVKIIAVVLAVTFFIAYQLSTNYSSIAACCSRW